MPSTPSPATVAVAADAADNAVGISGDSGAAGAATDTTAGGADATASADAGAGDVNMLLNAMYSIDVSDDSSDGGTTETDDEYDEHDEARGGDLSGASSDRDPDTPPPSPPRAPPTPKEMEEAASRLEARLVSARSTQRRGRPAAVPEADGGEFAALDESDVSDFHVRLPNPALSFPFELDDFQKRAVLCIERGENVFVAAHTSAGKTAVAEYAIELARRGAGKVCYTAPIKTLSNQKFRDFSGKFDSVGIVTGDVSIAPESQCVLMTTEILRSMLYRNDDMLWTVQWVVFDEVQYVNDKDRGVVWETCIIMLPPHVRIIMLSATVPNALEFAAWVGRIRQKQVSVVSTMIRPVPLQHSLLHADTGTLATSQPKLVQTVLLEQGGRFLEQNWAAATLKPREDDDPGKNDTAPAPRRERDAGGSNAARLVSSRGDGRGGIGTERGRGGGSRGGGESGSRGGSRGGDNQGPCRGRGRGRGNFDYGASGASSNVAWRGGGRNAAAYIRRPGLGERDGPSGRDDRSERGRGGRGGGRGGRGGSEWRGGRGARGEARGRGRGGGSQGLMPGHGTKSWGPLVRFVEENSLSPTIVFCFSKRKCAAAVRSLATMDLLPNPGEKSRVHQMFEVAMQKLQECDRNLPQLKSTLESLKKGIGCHHSGLLPLVKEVTEILFSEGLVKVLFATETFAMGVNFPAKNVVFVGIKKPDGRGLRMLKSGEYMQMAGRAGRRGLDTVGHVHLFFDPSDGPVPDEAAVRLVMTGALEPLKSAFRLTYNMILNLLRVDELRVEDMMQQSFSEAAEELKMENLNDMAEKSDQDFLLLNSWGTETQEDQDALRKYAAVLVQLERLTRDLMVNSNFPSDDGAFATGRIVAVKQPHHLLNFAMIAGPPVSASESSGGSTRQKGRGRSVLGPSDRVPVLSLVAAPSSNAYRSKSPLVGQRKSKDAVLRNKSKHQFVCDGFLFELSRVEACELVWFSDSVLRDKSGLTFPKNLPAFAAEICALQVSAAPFLLQFVQLNVLALAPSDSGTSTNVDPSASPSSLFGSVSLSPYKFRSRTVGTDESEKTAAKWNERDSTMARLLEPSPEAQALATTLWSLSGGWKERRKILACILRRERIRLQIEAIRASADAQRVPELLAEYEKRVSVLQKMQYVGEDGVSVLTKGRMGACEVATVDSVLLTELILGNILEGLEPPEIASLLSSFVCRQKNKVGEDALVMAQDVTTFSGDYIAAKAAMRSIIRSFGVMQQEAGIDLEFDIGDCEDYEASLCRWSLCKAVLQWATGSTFADIMNLTTLQEGDVVMCVKRLVELLRDAAAVSNAVGNEELAAKISEAIDSIKRDIIFNGSLYLE